MQKSLAKFNFVKNFSIPLNGSQAKKQIDTLTRKHSNYVDNKARIHCFFQLNMLNCILDLSVDQPWHGYYNAPEDIMATINDLIAQIENAELRERITREVERMSKQKKFGLVFEEHLPECTPLYDIPVKAGSHVALKNGNMNDIYSVIAISGEKALCLHDDNTQCELLLADLVCAAQFGEAIYPYLKPLDIVCNAPDSDLWHTLIEADNYHALQLLEYLYSGKVDCIYIDPPYNTGAKDWKYNNDYVDSADTYRHSKWLSMMKKRLELAKRLLNPADSVLIVTIDEKEYLHLGCLLEEMFPDARTQMVSSVINPSGVALNNEFGRTDEYLFFVKFGCAGPQAMPLSSEWNASNKVQNSALQPYWRTLRRRGSNDMRKDRPNMFYPIYFEETTGKILRCGEAIPLDLDRTTIVCEDKGVSVVWPIKADGTEGRWQIGQDEFKDKLSKGYVKAVTKNRYGWIPTYLAKGEVKKISDGIYTVLKRSGANNEVQLEGESGDKSYIPGTQWRISAHNARECGSVLLSNIIGTKRFSFPKSLYAVHDAIRFFVCNKPNALILDFFAGSGTTLHAVNLLNTEDGGHRRCIMVTNNEVSADEAKDLSAQGYHPGDVEWEQYGIARYVTWPRTVCSIEGHDVNGQPLKGTYLGRDIPMSEGFRANAAFFKLGFLDKTEVKLGRQFRELLPVIWLKAGAVGRCPTLESDTLPNMLILPENRFAVLLQEAAFVEFEQKMKDFPQIQTVFIVTDYEPAYVSMSTRLNVETTYQLYRDYLDNFRINIRRQ